MSHHPARYHQRTLARRDLPYRAARQIDQIRADTAVNIADIRAAAMEAAAEIEANAFAHHLAMNCAATLTDDESRFTGRNPLGAHRNHAIAEVLQQAQPVGSSACGWRVEPWRS